MTNKKVFKQANRHIALTKTLNLSVFAQATILLAILGIVLYSVFFTTYPDVHDYFHELRHNMMMIPCH